MGVPLAPRIDPRLRRYIVGADLFESPAEVTRAAGELAWRLGLTRPSYQQVRVLMGGSHRPPPVAAGVQTSKGRVVLHGINQVLDVLYQYPGPGLADWYERYKRGGS